MRSWKLLHGAMPAYDARLTKAVRREDLVSVKHRAAGFLETYFVFLFALNETTHPGEKRLIQFCRERCALLPAHFEENLEQLFQDLYCVPEQVAGDVRSIILELEKIYQP